MFKAAFIALLASLICVGFANADSEGSTNFVARPKIGAARLTLPSHLSWQATDTANGTHLVTLSLAVDVYSVLHDIRALSAAALDKAIPCGDLLKVRDASARLLGATTISYDLRFHYAKRLCAGGNIPLEIPADISCSSIIALSGAGAVVAADIRGATSEPCAIAGASPGLANFASKKVFKRHFLDLTQQLPPEFQGVTVNVRSIAFDIPPATPRLRITGDAAMSDQQFAAFTARARAVIRAAHN